MTDSKKALSLYKLYSNCIPILLDAHAFTKKRCRALQKEVAV